MRRGRPGVARWPAAAARRADDRRRRRRGQAGRRQHRRPTDRRARGRGRQRHRPDADGRRGQRARAWPAGASRCRSRWLPPYPPRSRPGRHQISRTSGSTPPSRPAAPRSTGCSAVLTVWGPDRDAAYALACAAWDQLVVEGPVVPETWRPSEAEHERSGGHDRGPGAAAAHRPRAQAQRPERRGAARHPGRAARPGRGPRGAADQCRRQGLLLGRRPGADGSRRDRARGARGTRPAPRGGAGDGRLPAAGGRLGAGAVPGRRCRADHGLRRRHRRPTPRRSACPRSTSGCGRSWSARCSAGTSARSGRWR